MTAGRVGSPPPAAPWEAAAEPALSPPARATFSGNTLSDQSSLHTADRQAVATAQKVEYIDLTAITTTWYNQLGANGWRAYHALGTDATHTNRAGANQIAAFVADAIRSQNLSLARTSDHSERPPRGRASCRQ